MSADHDLTDRLRALGTHPVDPALQSEHLTALAGVRGGRSVIRTSLAGRLKVGAGVLAGFLLGASGLTAVGAMGPLQPIAADVVEAVAPVDVPKGNSDEAKGKGKGAEKQGDNPSRLEDGSIGVGRIWDDGCALSEDGKTYAGNRGRYLKQERAKGEAAFEAAKLTDCGKPDEDAAAAAGEAEAKEAEEPKDKAEKSTEEHGKETAPGQNGERGSSEDAKPEDAGDAAEDAGKPELVPAAPTLPDQAAEQGATDAAPEHAPGEPAEPEAKPEDV